LYGVGVEIEEGLHIGQVDILILPSLGYLATKRANQVAAKKESRGTLDHLTNRWR
jgi:hypothetical protein